MKRHFCGDFVWLALRRRALYCLPLTYARMIMALKFLPHWIALRQEVWRFSYWSMEFISNCFWLEAAISRLWHHMRMWKWEFTIRWHRSICLRWIIACMINIWSWMRKCICWADATAMISFWGIRQKALMKTEISWYMIHQKDRESLWTSLRIISIKYGRKAVWALKKANNLPDIRMHTGTWKKFTYLCWKGTMI